MASSTATTATFRATAKRPGADVVMFPHQSGYFGLDTPYSSYWTCPRALDVALLKARELNHEL